MVKHSNVPYKIERERESERERERERQTDRQRKRDRQTDRERETWVMVKQLLIKLIDNLPKLLIVNLLAIE